MSLESVAWRQYGPPPTRRARRPTWGDRLARAAAFLILVGIFSFSVFAITLVIPFGPFLAIGILVVAAVFLGFRVRELRRRLDEVERRLDSVPPPPAPVADEPPA